jgi:hypothetical protein
LSNQTRWSWEDLLRSEFHARATGELGWSAEWRKDKLTRMDRARGTAALPSTPPWRRYACESFCDSAAWLFSGLRDHGEFTLAPRFRQRRARWFRRHFDTEGIAI